MLIVEDEEEAMDPDLMQSLAALDIKRIELADSGDKWPRSLVI
jgi:hypothetical protein